MKKKAGYIIATMLLSAMLSGCGDGSDEKQSEVLNDRDVRTESTAEAAETATETEQEAQPDMAAIEQNLKQLLVLLQATNNQQEIMELLAEEGWYSPFLPVSESGSESYQSQEDAGNTTLTVTAGYDQTGSVFVRAWYLYGEGYVQYLERTKEALRIADMSVRDGLYQGEFDIWFCRADKASIYHEKGTFVNGICVGEYTAQVYEGEESADLIELWASRKALNMLTFTGTFTEEGIAETKQPKEIEGAVALAYARQRRAYLLADSQVEAGQLVFGCSQLGLKAYPGFAAGGNADMGQSNQEGMELYESRSIVAYGQSYVPPVQDPTQAVQQPDSTVSGSN